jgi:glucan biosynthesis protein C
MLSTPAPASPLHGSAAGNKQAKHERRPDLDWLRTLIVLAIIPFHALVVFSAANATLIRQPVTSPLLPLATTTLEGWGIPFIFLLAGAASWYALRTRSSGAYARERLLRLLVPVVVVVLLFTPLRAYYLLLVNPGLVNVSPKPISDPARLGHIGAFFEQYWAMLFTTGSPIVVRNLFAHLWFVPRLLIVSFICLPLFHVLGPRWGRWAERIAHSRWSSAAMLLAGGLIMAAVVALLSPGWLTRLTAGFPLRDDWTALFFDLLMFVYGYLIYSSVQLRGAVRDLWLISLAGAVACWTVVLTVRLRGDVPPGDFSLPSLAFSFAQVFAIWLLTLAVLGLAMRYLASAPASLAYLTAAAFPVFVLHLPVLTVAAYYLQVLPVPWYLQAALIMVITAGVSFALYEYLVRRVPPLRFLFGLKPAQPRSARPAVDPAPPHS